MMSKEALDTGESRESMSLVKHGRGVETKLDFTSLTMVA